MALFEDAPAGGIQTDKLTVQHSFMPSLANKAFKLSNSEHKIRPRDQLAVPVIDVRECTETIAL